MRIFSIFLALISGIALCVNTVYPRGWETYNLSIDSPITGIAFASQESGIVTVQDTLIYQIRYGNSDVAQFNSRSAVGVVNDFPNYQPVNDYTTMPIWPSDSTIVLIREGSSHQEILASQDAGDTWRLFEPVNHPDLLYNLITIPEEMLYEVYLVDVPGEILIHLRDPVSLMSSEWQIGEILNQSHPPFTGIIAPITSDSILLATSTDSLVIVDLAQNTFSTFIPEINSASPKGDFSSLCSNSQRVMLGTTDSGTYRSTDAGLDWSAVEPNHQFRNLDWSWSTEVYAEYQDSLWVSWDAGSTWTNSGIRFPQDAQTWDVVDDLWLWAGGDSGRVYRYHLMEPDKSIPEAQTLPMQVTLQAYPNPFNASTTIEYSLPKTGVVNVSLCNLLGQVVWSSQTVKVASGKHHIRWEGTDIRGHSVASGIYLVTLRVDGNLVSQRKIALLK